MITLNIISPELKKEIKLKAAYQFLKKEMLLMIVFVVFYTAIILFSKYIISSYFNEISNKNFTANETVDKTIKDIDQINRELKVVSGIQGEEINWLKLIELISNNTDNTVKYSKISMNKESGLYLTGKSKTREGLLKIKKFLEDSPFLTDINFPISNLLEKENINFTITAKIKNYEFK